MAATTKPRRPDKLGTKAAKLWTSIIDKYELRPDEARILEDACREVDLIERLETEMSKAKLTSLGSMGQLVAHPLVQELRQHRAVLARLLTTLQLPDDAGGVEDSSTRARRAANARWARGS